MRKIIGELLIESKGGPVEYDGLTVYGAWSFAVGANQKLRLAFTGATGSMRQGLVLSAKDGKLIINEQTIMKAVLWTDTAPAEVEIGLRPNKGTMKVNVWNTWEDESGTQHAWIGNSGMLVEEFGNGAVLLRCSRGGGSADFTSLVAHVSVL